MLVICFFCILTLLPRVVPQEVCETKECHEAAEHIKKWMNPNFKPCENFYEFSCGYWHSPDNKTENKKHKSSLRVKVDLFDEYLKILAVDDKIVNESRMFKMTKQFLNLCLDEKAIDARGVSPAIQFMRQAGGWPVLEENWSEDNWDLLSADILLGGVLFKFEIPTDYGVYILVVRNVPDYPSELFIDDLSEGLENESIQKYYRENCDLAELFGAERSRAEEEMKDALQFEMALAELYTRTRRSRGFTEHNISQLQNDISWVNWTQLISSLPESVTLPANQSIIIGKMQYLEGLKDVINKYPKRTIANYMMSKVAPSLKDYLPTSVYNSTGEMNMNRSDFCMNLVKTSRLYGIVGYYIARHKMEDTRVATEMTQRLLEELLREVKELEWLDEETRSLALKKLQELKIKIGFTDEISKLETLEEHYKELKLNTSYFFEAAMDSEKWKRKDEFRRLGKHFLERTIDYLIYNEIMVDAYFKYGYNEIDVKAGFLHLLPLFSSKVPSYVNYGTLGVFIAHELTHALDFQTSNPEDDMNDGRNQRVTLRWADNNTKDTYDKKKRCFIDQYSSFNDTKYTGQMLNGNQTEIEDVADNGGLRLALQAYRRVAALLPTPEPKLPGLQQYSNEQLFMISVANVFCQIPTKEKLIYTLKTDMHSPFEFRIKGMMMNLPDFSKLFSCNVGDPMNPNNKCKVW